VKLLEEIIAGIEAEAERRQQETGRPLLGADRIRRQHPHDMSCSASARQLQPFTQRPRPCDER
jgi:hypothetical protein